MNRKVLILLGLLPLLTPHWALAEFENLPQLPKDIPLANDPTAASVPPSPASLDGGSPKPLGVLPASPSELAGLPSLPPLGTADPSQAKPGSTLAMPGIPGLPATPAAGTAPATPPSESSGLVNLPPLPPPILPQGGENDPKLKPTAAATPAAPPAESKPSGNSAVKNTNPDFDSSKLATPAAPATTTAASTPTEPLPTPAAPVAPLQPVIATPIAAPNTKAATTTPPAAADAARPIAGALDKTIQIPALEPIPIPSPPAKPAPAAAVPDDSPAMAGASKVENKDGQKTAESALTGPEISIILAENRFYPAKIRLREGELTRLIFTTVNPRPAALIMEGLSIQRWVQQELPPVGSEESRARWELNREIGTNRLTEILLEPKHGTYSFHDPLSGASGEITVE